MSSPGGEVDKLREHYLAALREAAFESETGDGPPDAALVWEAVAGALAPESRREVVDRVAKDPGWAEAWRLAVEVHRSVQDAAEDANETTTTSGKSGFWKRFGVLAAAASVLVLVGGGVLVREVLAPGSVYRSPTDEEIRSLLSEDLPVSRDGVELRWTSTGPGSRYEVTVTTESLRVVAAARDLEDPRFLVPPAALAELSSGAKLFWRVTARSRDGTDIHSPTFVVTIQ
jgi:hypothetical protein